MFIYMKKILHLLIISAVVLANLFGFLFISNVENAKMLFCGTTFTFDYQLRTADYNSGELCQALKQFSRDNGVDIMKYSFVNDTELHIYSANLKYNEKFVLKSGYLPSAEKFISNKSTDDHEQVGLFYYPHTEWEVRIYDFSQIVNVGIGSSFFISDHNEKVISEARQVLGRYGLIVDNNSQINYLSLINGSLFMMVVLSFLVTGIGILFFGVLSREKIYLLDLWGYSKTRILAELQKDLFSSAVYTIPILGAGLAVYTVCVQGLSADWSAYGMCFILVNMLITLLLAAMSCCSGMLVLLSQRLVKIKQGSSMWALNTIAITAAAVITVILFCLVCTTAVDSKQLREHVGSFAYWNKAEGVYRTCYSVLNPEIKNDLGLEREVNERIENFYHLMNQEKQALLINSEQFQHAAGMQLNTGYVYQMCESQDMWDYSPQGRRIDVNLNYLKKQHIVNVEGEVVNAGMLVNEPDTLNILVPEQFRDREERIRQEYSDYFFFQKVTVDNIYNEAMKKPLNTQTEESLKVHIIYTKSGQRYFTYNSNAGDVHNEILDPIAVVYTEGSVDSSHATVLAASSLFFESKEQGKAYTEIISIIERAKAPEITQVLSVYGEAGDQIAKEKAKLFQQNIVLFIIFFFTMLLFVICMGGYFCGHVHEMAVKYLYGYSYWRQNWLLVTVICGIGAVSAAISYTLYGSNVTWVVLAAYLFSEFAALKLTGDYLNKGNIAKISNGQTQ